MIHNILRLIIAVALLTIVVWILSSPCRAQTIAATKHSYLGHIEVVKVPSWAKTLMKIKVKGFRIEELFRPPNSTTTNLRVRSSISLSEDVRLKASLGGERSYGEMIYYTKGNKEWYARQEHDDSTIGWRIKW